MSRSARVFLQAFLAAFVWMSIAPAHASASSAETVITESAAGSAVAPSGGADALHGDDHGAGGYHEPVGVIPTPKQGIIPAIVALVSFGVVLAVLATQVWPRITKGLDERAEKIRSEIASAERARQQAKDALAEYEQSLSEARAQAQTIIDDARAQQERVATELRAKTEREIATMKDRAMREIDLARRSAVEELHGQAVTLGASIASRILEREVTAEDQDRLLAESLAELETANA